MTHVKFYDVVGPLNATAVENLRDQVVGWASEAVWSYVCYIGRWMDRVCVDWGPDGQFEWITFERGEDEWPWNPDDGVDLAYGELALATAIACRSAEEPGALIAAATCPCCGASLRVEHGDEPGQVVTIGERPERVGPRRDDWIEKK
jgi:hypothetical protein